VAFGRPTKYNDDMIGLADEYILSGYMDNEQFPTIAGLSLHLNVTRSTVYAWAKEEEKADFSDIVEKLMSFQELKLMNGGITGDYNSTITKLAMTKHNYSDKSESAHTGANGGPIEITDIKYTVVDPRGA